MTSGPVAEGERLGVFGGTFDPVHVGHLVAANEARHQLVLNRVLLVVAADPWQKHGQVTAAAADRYDLVAAAVEGVPGLEPSRLELERGGPSYTVDTIEQLTEPGRELYLVVGADVARRLDSWHRADDLRRQVILAVVGREGEPISAPPGWAVIPVSMPRLDVSATDVRARIAAGSPIDFLVPTPAARLIRARGLYTTP